HDDVRHLLRPRRHDLVEPGADEAPLVLVGHRLRPRDAGASLEPTLLVLVPPALQPPQAEADAQHREPFETAQPRRHRSNTSRSRSTSSGTTTGHSPTMAMSAWSQMGASWSLFTARTVPAARTPTVWLNFPDRPMPM